MKEAMASASTAFDIRAALDRLGGDEDLLKEVGLLFLDESSRLVDDIQAAVFSNDMPGLERAAHTLKGSIANFGDGPAYDCALRLEFLAKARKPEDVAISYDRLVMHIRLLKQEVKQYCG